MLFCRVHADYRPVGCAIRALTSLAGSFSSEEANLLRGVCPPHYLPPALLFCSHLFPSVSGGLTETASPLTAVSPTENLLELLHSFSLDPNLIPDVMICIRQVISTLLSPFQDLLSLWCLSCSSVPLPALALVSIHFFFQLCKSAKTPRAVSTLMQQWTGSLRQACGVCSWSVFLVGEGVHTCVFSHLSCLHAHRNCWRRLL